MILWVNIRVRSPPSWNPVFGTTWLRFSSRPRFRTRARNPVGPQPVDHILPDHNAAPCCVGPGFGVQTPSFMFNSFCHICSTCRLSTRLRIYLAPNDDAGPPQTLENQSGTASKIHHFLRKLNRQSLPEFEPSHVYGVYKKFNSLSAHLNPV